MVTLRSILYMLFLSITVILYGLPISIFGWILPYRLVSKVSQHWGKINLQALKLICGLGYQVQGKENLPSSTCIVLCKHQSAWEIITLRALLPPENTWVVKRELLWVPFFGWALAALRPITIDRDNARRSLQELLNQGKYWLDKGRWITIFPEGTRVTSGKRQHYNRGGAMLARKTGYPVLPIAHNAGVFWRRRDLKKYPGEITLVIGKPLNPERLSATEISRRVEEWIEETVAELPRRDLQ
ncbi:lysophospholipid acyltransferase family protein [Candidatus Thiosymbion oneisti]|uniref:lysophospholipid acyltransferase family protein n=1 Tax=Candidatus Thiosymbion oneisti TaxID=589554 RepID=UPI000B0AD66C|nr:lysophospholipid acyltransferase family protein [Candidatus Thiosymbion oneisti]